MAIFQYGNIITRISGSIGGTNFRLFRGMPVISNKSQGYSRNKLLSNPRLGALRAIFAGWAFLSSGDQGAWNSLALTLTFPDKFGNLRNISGRELYTKCNGQLLPAGTSIDDPTSVVSILSGLGINTFSVDMATHVAELEIINVDELNWFVIQSEIFEGFVRAPTFTRRKIWSVVYSATDFTVDLFNELIVLYPNMSAGNVVRIYITPMTLLGIRGTTSIVEATVS